MATHVVKKDRDTQLAIRGHGDTWTLAEDATLHVYGKPAILLWASARNTVLDIDGDILTAGVGSHPRSPFDQPFTLFSESKNATINIGETAHVTSAFYGFFMQGAHAVVNNAGDIDAVGAIALLREGRVTNSGSISGAVAMSGGIFINQVDGVVVSPQAVIGGSGVPDTFQTYINRGYIGGVVALDDGANNSKTVNTGTIEGNVSLGGGKDVFDTRGGVVHGKLAGGDGNDTFLVSGQVAIAEHSGEGTDTVKSSATFAFAANAEIEKLILTGSGDIDGTGSATANRITGNSGSNLLQGRAGDDDLTGGTGDDRLSGGEGADHFIFRKGDGADTILDFVSGVDQIHLKASGFADFTALSSHISDDADGNAVIALNNHDSIVLTGVHAAAVGAPDFVFLA